MKLHLFSRCQEAELREDLRINRNNSAEVFEERDKYWRELEDLKAEYKKIADAYSKTMADLIDCQQGKKPCECPAVDPEIISADAPRQRKTLKCRPLN